MMAQQEALRLTQHCIFFASVTTVKTNLFDASRSMTLRTVVNFEQPVFDDPGISADNAHGVIVQCQGLVVRPLRGHHQARGWRPAFMVLPIDIQVALIVC